MVAAGNLEGPLYLSGIGPIAAADVIYGLRSAVAGGRTFMAHRTGFTARTLTILLLAAGFRNLRVERDQDSPELRAHATR